MNALTYSAIRFGSRAVILVGVDRVVSEVVKTVIPPNASRGTRILFKVGSFGISTATTSIVGREIDEFFDTATQFQNEISAMVEEMEKNDE